MSWRASSGEQGGGHGARNQNERIVCILNPAAQSGRAGGRVEELRAALDRAFAQWSIVQTEAPGHATELAREALDGGADIVAAVGGDGTCHEVVNGFFDGKEPRCRRGVFALVPWGTGSDLARTIRAPSDLDDALWVAATGMTLPSDVAYLEYTDHDGSAASRVFINVAGFGMNGDVAQRANQGSKRFGGRTTFLVATVKSLLAYGISDVRLSWSGPDGEGAHEGQVLSAFLANGAYCGGGMWVGKGGTMHDGCLDITLLPPTSVARSLADTWRLYDGSAWQTRGAKRFRANVLKVDPVGEGEVLLEVDGEQPGRLPIRMELLEGAMQIRGGWLASPLLDKSDPTGWRP